MRIIAGDAGGRRLKSVRRSGTRPTMERVRESLLAILAPWLPGASFLDLFAGTGSVGLEALSRGADRAAFVDASSACAHAIRENLAALGYEQQAVVIGRLWGPALKSLAASGESFDIIFADPPYDQERILFSVAEKLAQSELLKPGGRLALQHTPRLALPDALLGNLERYDVRKFGETVLSFYRHRTLVIAKTSDPEEA